MLDFIQNLFKRKSGKDVTLMQTFGCTETLPLECPTFVERDVHKQFVHALESYNIIVVYGESRQGKTWTIEKYCSEQIRIGCNATMDVEQIKKEMLNSVGIDILSVEHSVSDEITSKTGVSSKIGQKILINAGVDCSKLNNHKETLKTTYTTVDISKNSEFINKIKEKTENKYFVFDNFHYLTPSVQQEFCSWLKEFNYHGIKIIIVGVWKEASRITSLAPDLTNRCQHIDIGTWSTEELNSVLKKGENALNISIDTEAASLYKKCCANNIGIFKDFLQKYCQLFDINKTCKKKRNLANSENTQKSAKLVIDEIYPPLHDRIVNLALPQKEKRSSKHMRQKIIISILKFIIDNDAEILQNGISLSDIKIKMDKLCIEMEESSIDISNITQELGLLHNREENRQTGKNFIPLFYFDKANKKLLILEPTIYVIKEYNIMLLHGLVEELLAPLKTNNICSRGEPK